MNILHIVGFWAIFSADLSNTQTLNCNQGEYIINDECCPMCGSGYRVQKHCTSTASTACLPCVSQSYMDHPNGLTECFPCKSCDSGSGFYVKRICTYIKNAVCGCIEGHYCAEAMGDEDCDFCELRTSCSPGYQVKTVGTETSDTVCEKCPSGTFSIANMSTTCTAWTSCHALGMFEEASGTSTSDAACRKSNTDVIIGIISVVIIVVLISVASCVVYRKKIWDWIHKEVPQRREEEAIKPLRDRGGRETVPSVLRLPVQEKPLPSSPPPEIVIVPVNRASDASSCERGGDTNG